MGASSGPRRIFAGTRPTDLRKSFQGLLALVQRVFRGEDPYAGSLVRLRQPLRLLREAPGRGRTPHVPLDIRLSFA